MLIDKGVIIWNQALGEFESQPAISSTAASFGSATHHTAGLLLLFHLQYSHRVGETLTPASRDIQIR